MTAPTEPAESIPTDSDSFVRYLVNFFRHSQSAAQKAVKEYEAPDEIPAAK